MTGLADAQREIARLVRAPEGVGAALAERGDVEGRTLAERLRGDSRVGAVARLEIYANGYFYRLRDVLGDEYPALAAAMGDAAFNDLAALYVGALPSSERSLRWIGSQLAGFLDAHLAAAPFRQRWPWAGDLARLEWGLSEAFDAADAAVLTRADLAAIAPERWAGLVFRLHPATRILQLDWPVRAIQRTPLDARTSEELAAAIPERPSPTPVLVWRRGERPQSRALEALEVELLSALASGDTFAALCDRAAAAVGDQHAAATVAERLGVWVESGLLSADYSRTPAITSSLMRSSS